MYIVQSVQTYHQTLTLVQGKNAYVRVFVVADRAGAKPQPVSVKLYAMGNLEKTLTVQPPAGLQSVPTSVDQGNAGHSWNAPVPGNLIVPGLNMSAEIGGTPPIVFPATGTQAAAVASVPAFGITFVPLSVNGSPSGDVTAISTAFMQKIYPLGTVNEHRAGLVRLDAPGFPDDDQSETTVLDKLQDMRRDAHSGDTYYGVFHQDDVTTLGAAWVGIPVGFGWDEAQANGIAAHEVGHTFGRQHAPCGNPLSVDPTWPSDSAHTGGQIGVYGFDVQTAQVKAPSLHDVMGYCNYEWTSDHTYQGVFNHFVPTVSASALRRLADNPAGSSEVLFVSGIVRTSGDLRVSPPYVYGQSTPTEDAGESTITGLTESGQRLFMRHFALVPQGGGDLPSIAAVFEVGIPMDKETQRHLSALRIVTPQGSTLIQGTRHGEARAEFRFGPNGELVASWDRRQFVDAWFLTCNASRTIGFSSTGTFDLGQDLCSDITVRLSTGVTSFNRDYRILNGHVVPAQPEAGP